MKKKEYTTPELRILGPVEGLTAGWGSGGGDLEGPIGKYSRSCKYQGANRQDKGPNSKAQTVM
jgi:hypothetical protein